MSIPFYTAYVLVKFQINALQKLNFPIHPKVFSISIIKRKMFLQKNTYVTPKQFKKKNANLEILNIVTLK